MQDNDVYIDSSCSKRCTCTAGILLCYNSYSCDANAVCEERHGIRQCVCNAGFTGDGTACKGPHTDCFDIFKAGYTDDGVYTIIPAGWNNLPFSVYCNMSNGGGWTVKYGDLL